MLDLQHELTRTLEGPRGAPTTAWDRHLVACRRELFCEKSGHFVVRTELWCSTIVADRVNSFTGFHGPNEIEACFNLLALALPVRLSLNLLPISPKSLKTGKTASILSSTCPQDSVVAVHVKRAVDLPVPGFSCTFPRKESTFLIKWDREAKYVEEILLRSEAQASQSSVCSSKCFVVYTDMIA